MGCNVQRFSAGTRWPAPLPSAYCRCTLVGVVPHFLQQIATNGISEKGAVIFVEHLVVQDIICKAAELLLQNKVVILLPNILLPII